MDLNQTRVFVEVVRAGGFAAAARRLSLPKSTISARIQALEDRLGAQLLKRSTRQLSLTAEGQAYFEAVSDAVETLVGAEAASTSQRGVLSGAIRFTAPLEFPREPISLAIASFLAKHSKVRFEVTLTNRAVDLVAENYDIALRGGEPGAAGHIIRKVGSFSFGLYASPAYLHRCGVPTTAEELQHHDQLLFRSESRSRVLRTAEALAAPEPRVCSDNFSFLRRLAIAGAGITSLPEMLAARDVAAGRLVQVLEGWAGEPATLHLVFPSRRDMTPRVRAFADHLAASFAQSPLLLNPAQ
jgi:DNA-binding transcriptional LysR family regulator